VRDLHGLSEWHESSCGTITFLGPLTCQFSSPLVVIIIITTRHTRRCHSYTSILLLLLKSEVVVIAEEEPRSVIGHDFFLDPPSFLFNHAKRIG
jgi:hypothetical protein